MQKAEKELIEEKFKGVIAMIRSNNDISQIYHKELLEQQNKVLDQVLITNGRVTNIEKQTKIVRFFESHPKIMVLVVLGVLLITALLDLKDIVSYFK